MNEHKVHKIGHGLKVHPFILEITQPFPKNPNVRLE